MAISTLQFNPTNGFNNGVAVVTCTAITGRDTRNTTVTVSAFDTDTYPGLKKTINITQIGKTAFISSDQSGSTMTIATGSTSFVITGSSNSSKITVTYTADGTHGIVATLSKLEISVDNGVTWSVITNDSPIDGDPGTTAQYPYRATFSCPANATAYDLSGIVTVASTINNATITVVQPAKVFTLSINKTSQVVPKTVYRFLVEVTANDSYSVISQNDWITASNTDPTYISNIGGNTWVVTTSENTSGINRVGTLTFASTIAAGVSAELTISQDSTTEIISTSGTTCNCQSTSGLYYSDYITSNLNGYCRFIYVKDVQQGVPVVDNAYVQFIYNDDSVSELFDITDDNFGQGVALNCGLSGKYVKSLRWAIQLTENSTGNQLVGDLDVTIINSANTSVLTPAITIIQE